MRLKQLTINNFGIYIDENTFSFPYSNDKKVSIVIGKNGAGKTTFLNAIKICLFGSMILKNRTITKSYKDFIMDKLNKDALKETIPRFGVKATFISRVHNYDGEFTIERTWDVSNSFKESVYMKRNGKSLTDDEQTSFFNALYHAFPLDLFELFYLDGEKIDQLSVLNSNIFTLIESSINIDLFKKLRSDLLTYASKRVNSKKIAQITERKEELELKRTELNQLIQDTYHSNDLLHKNIDSKADEIKNLRDSLHIKSFNISSVEMNRIESNINDLKRSIEDDLIKYLPYTLVTNQLSTLLDHILKEYDQNKNTIVTGALNSKELSAYLKEQNAFDKARDLIEQICAFYPTDNEDLIHKLSDDDFYSLKAKVTNLLNFNKVKLIDKMKKLDSLEQEYSDLSSNAAEIEALKSAGQLDHLLSLQSELNDFELTQKENDETILINEAKISNLDNELKALENELWTQLKKSNITNVLDQIHTVLDQYINQIKAKKIKEIEHHTKTMFDRLIRKKGFINDFKIENDAIYLMDKNNNKLNHSNLSAGEKQLFVLSLLYAVLQSSERRVPLMFDTLLGRLDEEHRDNVFKEFISSCPDQVIILATDSELSNIDKEYLTSITNTEYTIDFSKSENQMTEVRA
ncbi:DNA sulfur modification protein DndD [Clostridium sediminicola]|uniref:DNA sulfur modification protein DndD n=1 Tax=Clostridium sediminicola TaxID=3114879 RepID=UPI0031F23834